MRGLQQHTAPSTDWARGPRARKLLRLYLAWPNRFTATSVDEAELFYQWLLEHYAEMTVVNCLQNSSDVAVFLRSNPDVIEAAKFLKPAETSLGEDIRRTRRIRVATQVFIGVYECQPEPSLIGHAVRAFASDVTPDGLGVEIGDHLPAGTILNITIAPAGQPVMLYRVTGEVRWADGQEGRYQLGISLLEVDDYQRWQDDFSLRFEGMLT